MLKYVAGEIASVATSITGYPTIITDETGTIIGADKDNIGRLGELHEASLEVIATGRKKKHTIEECRNLKGTFPGVTMPVSIHDEVVGSIGIKGDSVDVERFGMLVKMIAEIMLKDRIEAESAHIKHANIQMLITMLITSDGSETSKTAILNQAKLLGLNLSDERVPIVVSRKEAVAGTEAGRDMYSTDMYKAIRRQFSNRQDIIVVLDASLEKYLIFVDVEGKAKQNNADDIIEKCINIQHEMKEKENTIVYFGMDKPASSIETLKAGYKRAEMVLGSAILNLTDKTIVNIRDIPLERMIMEASEYYKDRSLERRIKAILLDKNAQGNIELITTWCESMFNFAETARRLGIHKNTLTYRFEKIKDNCGIDLHDFSSTIAIYLCIRITGVNGVNKL